MSDMHSGTLRRPESAPAASTPRILRLAALLAAVAGLVLAAAAPARAAQEGVTQISSDPFTAPPGEHATEVEPDTFAHGSTVVSAFQTGRIFNGGSSDVGWATSTDGGNSWTHGFLPSATTASNPPGPFIGGSDASVAYDARHKAWLISWLGLHALGGGIVDVMVSRSTDDGHTWSAPIAVAANGTFYDKNWTACDNTPSSPHYGNCYTEFDDVGQGDLELMSTSSDGGLRWGPPTPTADRVHGLGGQPVVQPDGRVVVPFEGFRGGLQIRSFSSDDGGRTWNASVQVSPVTTHEVAGPMRTSPLPTAEINRDGKVYVAWQDSRFEPGGSANDIVYSTSTDGTSWSDVTRIPLDPVASNVDHFIPGLAVNRHTGGDHTQLALTYYFFPNADCTPATCQLMAGFTSSLDGGSHWSDHKVLFGPMKVDWLAPTSQGFMTGDYVSTSFLAGQQRVIGVFAGAFAPASDGTLNEPMFAALEKVRGGGMAAGHERARSHAAAKAATTAF